MCPPLTGSHHQMHKCGQNSGKLFAAFVRMVSYFPSLISNIQIDICHYITMRALMYNVLPTSEYVNESLRQRQFIFFLRIKRNHPSTCGNYFVFLKKFVIGKSIHINTFLLPGYFLLLPILCSLGNYHIIRHSDLLEFYLNRPHKFAYIKK